MDKLIPNIKHATALRGYKLKVEFEDGVNGIIDLSKWKGKGVFEYWNNEDNFKLFKITADKKIEWGEEIDMDPDAFYLKLVGKSFEEYARDKQLLWHPH
ncbi:MAG TPA: DUF2442 domain-containing protein [Chitinophagaceae bacterium]|nr:DUF2442 domain-containing protein [Chitinophagaceae bacterium]